MAAAVVARSHPGLQQQRQCRRGCTGITVQFALTARIPPPHRAAPGRRATSVCVLGNKQPQAQFAARPAESDEAAADPGAEPAAAETPDARRARIAGRAAERRRQQLSYQLAAVTASSGLTAVMIVATWARFTYHLAPGADISSADVLSTILLAAGFVYAMEMWARWAHRALWHDSLWHVHRSHHEPRLTQFEDNDVFAIANALPAMALLAYGFFTPGIVAAAAWGSGLGITVFGLSYMFVHDGLVHKRFPVGPIGQVPYLKRVAAAHALHHSERYAGVPWGLFLGPQELEAVGAGGELDRLVEEREAGGRR